MSDGAGPLGVLRVIEMGQLLAGPFCGQLLGDFGAEVVKVEQPGVGDPMREWGREKAGGLSLWWPIIARNKKLVTVNLRTPAGQAVIKRLVAQSDILIENFRPGTLESWGMSYAELSDINPRLILVRVTGCGQSGPYSKRAGYDSIGEAMGGLRYVTGAPDSAPSRVGISIGDSLAGTMAALGALAAVEARHATGRGQVVDSAIYEAMLTYMESLIPEYELAGHIRERTGSVLPNVAPSNVYGTKDGHMVLIAANQHTVFSRLARAMGRPQLSTSAEYATHTQRGKRQSQLDELTEQWTLQNSSDELLQLLDLHGVPAGHIYRAPEMFTDPHFQAGQSIVKVPHGELGEISMQTVAPKLSDTPGRVRWAGGELGHHNEEVLTGLLGLTAEEVAAAQ